MDGGLAAARSPSFNSYSNTGFLKIADRVVVEEDNAVEFEFGIVARDLARFRPIYPVFGKNLLTEIVETGEAFRGGNGLAISHEDKPREPIRRHPLRKLFIDERETTMTSSCSSSETDDLDGVPADTSCFWRPKVPAVARCKRWRLKVKEFLHRSHSDVSEGGVVFIGASKPMRRRP